MPKKIFLVLFIVLSIFAITNSLNAQWVQINNGLPNNVGITALATYGTIIFAGTLNNGVFLSTNGGTSWSPVNNGLANPQVQTIAVAGNYIYAGTNGNGVYRSSDLGSSWQLVNTGLTNLTITYLYVSGNYIFAGTYGGGIFRLPINGLTWTQVNNGLTTQYINAFAYNGQYLFAGGTGLFGSTNNGSSWTSLGNFNNIWIHTIAVLGTDVFVGTENHGVYRSTDNGNTWTQINYGLPSLIVQSLYVVGTSIFAGTNSGVYLSTNNGDSWSYADLIKIAFSFVTLGTDIYAGTGFTTGVYKRSLSQMMQVVNVTITSDNAYVFGFGDINGITNYYYPGVCNYLAHEIYSPNTGTETYTIAGSLSGKYIYIAAWSDELTYQGTIAQFSDGNTTILTSPTLPNPYVHWEVYATGINLNPQSNDPEPIAPAYIPRRNSNFPTLSEINTQIAIANQNAGNPTNTSVGWVGTTPIPGRVGVLAFGPNNVANNYGFPPQTVSGINPNAQWMWYNPDPTQITQPFVTDNFPNFPASLSREYYIFRVGPLDSLFIDTCIAPPQNMVAWWTMDESSNPSYDLAGFNNLGNWVNNPTPLSGKVAGALSFFNNYLEVQSHPELDFGRTDFTIDAWINTGNCKEGTISPIVDKYDVNTNRGFVFYLTQNPVGTLFLNLNINGTTYTSSTPIQISNQWYHIAVTVLRNSSSPIGIFYINGQQVGTFAPHGGPVTNDVNLWIGRSRISNNNCIVWIDELELFNRSLSGSEIYSIWAAGSFGKCKPESSTICIAKFNDVNGNGSRDDNEPLLNGWTFNITDNNNNLIGTITTSENYKPCLKVPAPGSYIITEVLQQGWVPTTQNPQTITVSPGQTYNLIFGNRRDSCVTPPNSMLNWWPLDETSGTTAYDIAHYSNPSSFDNNGTWVNNPTPVTGKVSGALKFSGNNYVQVPNHSELNFGTGDFSIDAWVWTQATTGRRTIIDKREKWNTNVLGYEVFIENGILSIQLADGTFTNYSSSAFIADGNWHHIAITVKRNDPLGLVFYVDGNIVTILNPTNHQGSLDNKAPLLIGGNLFDPDYHFIGIIDEVEIFKRVLTQQEIQSIWAAGSYGKCKTGITNIGEFNVIPSEFKLLQCYPNPFNPSTNIEFYLPKAEFVKLSIFDILGREIAVLVDENVQAGKHSVTFDASNLLAGVYFYRMQAGKFQETRKFILLK
jgi:hypothetical protein